MAISGSCLLSSCSRRFLKIKKYKIHYLRKSTRIFAYLIDPRLNGSGIQINYYGQLKLPVYCYKLHLDYLRIEWQNNKKDGYIIPKNYSSFIPHISKNLVFKKYGHEYPVSSFEELIKMALDR